MKKRHTRMTALCALVTAALTAAPALAGWVYDGEITVPAGATNATATAIIRGGESSAAYTAPIDRMAALNASASATGRVTFAVADLGGVTVISASTNLPPGSVHADWPERAARITAGGATGAVGRAWQARRVTVSVTQTATNAAPAVYRWQIGTR